MSEITAYLIFNGNCAEAMHFYEKVLGGKIALMMKMGESPMADHCPPGMADRIMHAHLAGKGISLMASDAMLDKPYEGMKGFSLSLGFSDVAEAGRVYDALVAGGQVTMPMQKTFWSESFGMLVDRFGVSWMVNVPAADFKPA